MRGPFLRGGQYFYYWTVLHVTVSFVPRPSILPTTQSVAPGGMLSAWKSSGYLEECRE